MPSLNLPPTQSLLTKNPKSPIFYEDAFAMIRYILEIGGTGTGDVVGTPPSTDNAITRYDGATGLLIQNSPVTISDAGVVNIPAGQTYNINGVPIGGGDIMSNGSVDFTATETWDAGGATNTDVSPTGMVVNVVAGGNAQYLSNQMVLGNVGGAASSLVNDGTASFTDGGGNTVSIDPVLGLRVMNGAVGTPSHSFTSQTDMGLYRVSGTQLGLSVAGALQATVDSAIGGIATDVVSERVGGAGVTITGTGGLIMNESRVIWKKFHLTSAQIQTGNSVPIVLVTAAGAGTAIYAWHETTARCINGAVPAVATQMKIQAAGGANPMISFGTGFLNNTTNNLIMGDDALGIDRDDVIIENANLVVTFDADNPAFDGTIDIYLKYEIITL